RDRRAQHPADVLRPSARRVDELVRLRALAGAQHGSRHRTAPTFHPDDLVREERGAEGDALVPESYEHAVRVEPAVIGGEYGAPEVVDVHRREPSLQLIGFEVDDSAAVLLLDVVVAPQLLDIGRRNNEQVTVLRETDLRRHTV